MKKLNVIGISRESQYSPNLMNSDAAIFNLVTRELQKKGWQITTCPEDLFEEKECHADVIYTMARDKRTIERLLQLEEQGTLVINAAKGLENCVRRPLTELFIQHQIPYPESFIWSTDQYFDKAFFPCWFKRGDSSAIVKEDVCFVESREQANRLLEQFKERGIKTIVVNKHLEGDLVKFYGVRHVGFFDWVRSRPDTHSKFGLEQINGMPVGYDFDIESLKKWSDEAAKVLGITVYGGDCVISADGSFKFIDFNDWPSFSRCREEAGKAIAESICYLTEEHLRK